MLSEFSLCLVKHSQFDIKAPYDSTTTYYEIEIPTSNSSPIYSGQKIPQGNPEVRTTISAKSSQEPSGNSPLEFAPFVPSEHNQFDYIPTVNDSLLSPTIFEWDMANMWMPSFEPDTWTSADMIELTQEPNIF